MLTRFGEGTEERDVSLLLRFVDVGGAEEERRVVAAGFRVVTKAGPNWVVTGPMSGLPKLLEIDRIIYIEGASQGGQCHPDQSSPALAHDDHQGVRLPATHHQIQARHHCVYSGGDCAIVFHNPRVAGICPNHVRRRLRGEAVRR